MANKTKLMLFDGLKASLLWDEETPGLWNYMTGGPAMAEAQLFRTIPVLYRGITIISDSMNKVPFSIMRGKTEVDTSADWQNKIGFMPNPNKTFKLISQALDRGGCAYLLKSQNRGRVTKELKWLAPSTITPKLDADSGLTGFKRQVGSKQIPDLLPDQVVYFWLADSDVEVGPPQAWPLKSALSAAGVLGNLNEFISKYFERGAIRPTLVFVKGAPSKEERERMEKWYQTLMGGIKRAFQWKIFNADTVDTKQIGDGLDQLQDQTLTADQRQDVALALGIPQTILFANSANYATSESDIKNFYDMTIVPRCEFIASIFNEQLLDPLGLSLVFSPESLDMYQEDENSRAQALKLYVDSGYTLLMASDILGIDLTDPQRKELEAAEAEKQANKQRMAELAAQAPKTPEQQPPANNQPTQFQNAQQQAQNKALDDDLAKWRRKATKSFEKSGVALVPFESEVIPLRVGERIAESLKSATTQEAVDQAFDINAILPDLAVELQKANILLQREAKRQEERAMK